MKQIDYNINEPIFDCVRDVNQILFKLMLNDIMSPVQKSGIEFRRCMLEYDGDFSNGNS